MKKNNTEAAVLEFAKRDELLCIDVVSCLKRGMGEILYADERGFLVYDKGGEVMMAAAENESALNKLTKIITEKESDLVILHRDLFVNRFFELGFKEDITCYQAVYPVEERLFFEENGYEIKRIPLSYLKEVNALYSHMDDEEYIGERLEAGMLGAFLGNELCAIAGTHAEDSIGLLEVAPKHRGKGLGYALEAAMINFQLDRGHIPYAQVDVNNTASLSLQKKLGMKISSERVVWLEK